jgi:hypothetical protein
MNVPRILVVVVVVRVVANKVPRRSTYELSKAFFIRKADESTSPRSQRQHEKEKALLE